MKGKDGEYYWINCPAYDEQLPLMVARYAINSDRWMLGSNDWINNGPHVEIVRHVVRPRNWIRRARRIAEAASAPAGG